MRRPSVLILHVLTLGFVVTAASAAAEAGEAYFKTPSGNIFCAYADYDGVAQVRCDIRDYQPSLERPADCDLDWGDSFAVADDDAFGEAICHGDTVINPAAKVLAYGKTFRGSGISCTSEKRGLTCTSQSGHGFFLSRAKQDVF